MWPGGAEEQQSVGRTEAGREGRAPPQLLHTWRFYSAPRGVWDHFSSCYGERSPRGGTSPDAKMKTSRVPRQTKGREPAAAQKVERGRFPPSPRSEVNLIKGAGRRESGDVKATCGDFPQKETSAHKTDARRRSVRVCIQFGGNAQVNTAVLAPRCLFSCFRELICVRS